MRKLFLMLIVLAALLLVPTASAANKNGVVVVSGSGEGMIQVPSSAYAAPDDECMRYTELVVSADILPSPNCGGMAPPPPPAPAPAPGPAPAPCCAPPTPQPPAPAPTPQPLPNWIGCKTFHAYRGLDHVFGYMLFRYYVQKEFCSNGYSIYKDETWRWVTVNAGWQFMGHIDQTQTLGNSRSYYTQGKFAPPLAAGFATKYPFIKVCYDIDGNWSICGAGG